MHRPAYAQWTLKGPSFVWTLAGQLENGRPTNSVELFRASPSVAQRLLNKRAPKKDSYHTTPSEIKSDIVQVCHPQHRAYTTVATQTARMPSAEPHCCESPLHSCTY